MYTYTANGISGSPPTMFQTYLTRAIPFRRRHSSVSSIASPPQHANSWDSASGSPITPITPMSPTNDSFFASPTTTKAYEFQVGSPIHSRQNSQDTTISNFSTSDGLPTYLSGHSSHISCSRCHADLALTSQIISKGFTGRHGRAYLVAPSNSSLTSTPCTSSGGSNCRLIPLAPPFILPPQPSAPRPPPPSQHSSQGSNVKKAPHLPNTNTHKPVPRNLVTGMHTVADVTCAVCGAVLGWKYVSAEEVGQRYKVGKFILETRRCCVGVCWEGDADREGESGDEGEGMGGVFFGGVGGGGKSSHGEARERGVYGPGRGEDWERVREREKEKERDAAGEIMFDSQDEEECEDLFSGIWSPALAKRRRERKGSFVR